MSKKPLEGIRVVEHATFIAAPAASRFLADLGAEVIKIESLRGDQLRFTAPTEGRPLNQLENTTFDLENANKKGIAFNPKDPKGVEILNKLIETADIFITNIRTESLIRNKIDYETLHAKYPALVYAHCTGYGDKGPDKDLPGFDFTSYFARGGYLGTLYNRGSEPMNIVPGLGDHNVGMNLAAGILAALFQAKMTGQGEKVSSSLFHSAIYNLGLMIGACQYPDYGKPYPIDRRESANPINCPWGTSDGRFIQTAAPNYDTYYEPLMKALGREDLLGNEKYFPIKNMTANNAGPEVFDILKAEFAKKTVAELEVSLKAFDIPFAVAKLWEEIIVDEQAWANDYLYEMEYDNGVKKTLVRPPVNFEEMGVPEYTKGPLLGENSTEILKGIGYSDEEIKQMMDDKVIVETKRN